jgi:hypothetical protein
VSITVLATLASAIALAVAAQSLAVTRTESTRLDSSVARASAIAAMVAFEQELAVDPMFMYTSVSAVERPRVCAQGGGGVVQPGQSWPRTCGTTWTYTDFVAPPSSWVEVTPPGPASPRLSVRATAKRFGVTVSVDAGFVLDGVDRFTLASTGDLNLSPFGSNASGEFAAAGQLTYSTNLAGVTAAASRFSPAVVGGVTPTNRFTDLASGPAAARLSLVQLRAGYAPLVDIACPGGSPSTSGGTSSQVCIRPGSQLVNTAGTLVTVPANTRAVLLVEDASGNNLRVYTSSFVSNAPTTCGSPCNLASASAASLAASRHPGALSFWTLLADVPYPASGLVFSSVETHLGLCGAGFASGSCLPVFDAAKSFTLLVGTSVAPADLYISGAVTSVGGAVGVVASGRVVIPYWSRTQGGNVTFEGYGVALGNGVPAGTAAIETLPAAPATPARGGTFTLGGSFVADSIATSFGLFNSAVVGPHRLGWGVAPPLFLSPQGAWRMVSTTAATGGSSGVSAAAPAAVLSAPNPPTALVATPGNGSVSLSWSAPVSSGSAGVTDYAVEYSSGSGYTVYVDAVSTATSVSVIGLSNGVSYSFRVAAVSSAGKSWYSESVSAVPTAPVPSAPSSLTAAAGVGSATLTWSIPSSSGSSPITDYVVEVSNGAGYSVFADGVSTSTSAVVTGLAANRQYSFRVRALSAQGQSLPSNVAVARPT